MTSILKTGALVAACTVSLFALSACGGSGSSVSGVRPAPTAGGSGEIRRVPAMSLNVHKMIQAAQEALSVKDLDRADALLENTLAYERINDYERAVAWQLKAMVGFERDDTSATIKAYETILSYKDSIPVALELNIILGLSMLEYSEENYQQALVYIKEWERRTPRIPSDRFAFISQINYVLEDYPQAEAYMARAIAAAKTEGLPPKELWHTLLMSAQWEQNRLVAAQSTLQTLLMHWPKQRYCLMLAGIMVEQMGDRAEALKNASASSITCTATRTTMAPEKLTADMLNTPDLEGQSDMTDGDYLPQNRRQALPIYPRRAQEEGISGRVVLEFTVLPDGTVDPASILVLESDPPGYFEESAKTATLQFRYRPKIIGGKAQTIQGVRYTFSYALANK